MAEHFTLQNKLKDIKSKSYVLNGISFEQWAFFLKKYLFQSLHHLSHSVYVFPNLEKAEQFYELVKSEDTVFYPDLGCDVYSSIMPSEANLFRRFSIISKILTGKPLKIVTTIDALLTKLPEKEFFSGAGLKLEISDIISPYDLAKQLVELGYSNSITVEEPGTFAHKGEIFDIYPTSGDPIRIHYFDDMIEEMFAIEKETLKTLRDKPIETIKLEHTPFSVLQDEYIKNFRNKFPRPNLNEKERFEYRKEIISKLSKNRLFDDYPLFLSLFFNNPTTLLNYLDDYTIQYFDNFELDSRLNFLKNELHDQYSNYLESDQIKPLPEQVFDLETNIFDKSHLIINDIVIEVNLDQNFSDTINFKLIPTSELVKQESDNKELKLQGLLALILDKSRHGFEINILYKSEKSLKEIKYLFNTYYPDEDLSKIHFLNANLSQGFIYENEKKLYLADSDFFVKKTRKYKKQNDDFNSDLFADQLATLNIGDHIIHKDHGIGKYLGIETLELNGSISDYIVLLYQDEDKVYVPIYKLNLLQKHSTNQAAVSLANLKTKKFDNQKAKVKSSVKKLAFDLLELQAKRQIKKGHAFAKNEHLFTDFELSFPFEETPDQQKAIDDIIADMESPRPMDRLVCGDVGFGKTEVAMRAAYKAVLDNKQVCVLVPTTVLAFQHFNSFVKRYKNTAVRIEYISRFKTTKQVNEILADLADGKVDILIGTHKIISEKIKYPDLGLIIIDEEQRFGVAHKEKLKLMRESIDTLTLTATPIPRTLQMSFLGIKDLSVIKTPPPRRQSIKTYLIKEDHGTIKAAIEKELQRGGQVFIVHNKVQDIEIFTAKIRNLVPNAKLEYAHGQMSEKELEKKISDFYKHKFDILIATTIIESGIDIPSANTMIVDRADMYGLAQLHQLRGRIGRSDKKAYAYFMIPAFKKINEVAAKRLKALQTYADIGSGFNLATSDLEIRGSGDILGPEQSGHIASIGLELYMELLQDAINEIKGDAAPVSKQMEIQTPFSTLIPEGYINSPSHRLKYYKKISNSKNEDLLDDIEAELVDQFGPLPNETQNLFTLIHSRILLNGLGINNLRVKTKTITLAFDKETITKNQVLQSNIIGFFTQRPKIYKINPDFSIICNFKDKITIDTLFEFAKHIAEQIKTC